MLQATVTARPFGMDAPCRIPTDRRNSLDAIFVHSSFRASSTWIWSRFRKMSDVLAYHEIFHEALATLTRQNLAAQNTQAWHSKHPEGEPYFLEFEPLIQHDGGIAHFDRTMAFESFLPRAGFAGQLTLDERIYLGHLIEHAQRLGRTPVLADTRSLGRLMAMKTDFPGWHILLYRNLFQQWCSYSEQLAHRNPYFMQSIKRTLECNQQDRFFQMLKEKYPLGAPSLTDANYFYCFVLLHLYIYAHVVDAADMLIDINALERDKGYRHNAEMQIIERTGVQIDFADVKKSIAFSFTPLGSAEAVAAHLSGMVAEILRDAPSASARAFVTKALDELLEEYERYMFYAGSLAGYAAPGGVLATQFDRDMQTVMDSTSWRVTAPLRGVKKWLSRKHA